MTITAEAVKQLRERTGAGMMECKRALVEAGGDLDAAAELMRKQGLVKADKKAARIAAEGTIVIERSADGLTAAIAEINCETDFVAREQDFRAFASATRCASASLPTAAATRSMSGGARWWPRSVKTSVCGAWPWRPRRPPLALTFMARESAPSWGCAAVTRRWRAMSPCTSRS